MVVMLKKLYTQNTQFWKIQVLVVLVFLHVWYWHIFHNFLKFY